MDVHQLKTLIHVAELGSLSKAADRLNIAQPALSRQIRLMEAELGAPLFTRHGRGMVITGLGRDVLHRAENIMRELQAINALPSAASPGLSGTVAVGTTPTVGEIVAVPLARHIAATQPDVTIRFSSAFSGYLTDWLQRGQLDVAAIYDLQPVPSLRIEPVMVEDLLLIGSASAGLSLDNPVGFPALAGERLVLPSPRHGLRSILDACAGRAGIALTAAIEADSLTVLIDLVRHGFGPTILPLAPIHRHVVDRTLTAAPLINPTPVRTIVLAYPADRPVAPAARYVAGSIVAIAKDLVARQVWMGTMLR